MKSSLLRAYLVLTSAATALGCATSNDLTDPVAPARLADHAVYSAVLSGLFPSPSGGPARYVLSDSTERHGSGKELSSEYVTRQFGPELIEHVKEAAANFAARSAESVALDASAFRVHGTVELVSQATLKQISDEAAPLRGYEPAGSYWAVYYARFPGARGKIGFSRPGYDADGRHALLSYSHGCGSLCADYGYVLLGRRNGVWVVLKRAITLMS